MFKYCLHLPAKRATHRFACFLMALAMVFCAPTSQAQNVGTYKVVDVAQNDVLNVRSGASYRYPIQGIIPPNGRGITIVGQCVKGWCNVTYQGTSGLVSGWVNALFLAPENPGTPTVSAPSSVASGVWLYRVVGVAGNDVLNVREGPSPQSKIVGMIPPSASDVLVLESGGQWWHVLYNSAEGWVNSEFLRKSYFCAAPACPVGD
jgi:uncharacterized protein YraI